MVTRYHIWLNIYDTLERIDGVFTPTREYLHCHALQEAASFAGVFYTFQ
jgi:hypothetical protein